MTVETYIAIGSLIISAIAIFSSLRKNTSEVYNLDAKTFNEYQDIIKKAKDNYEAVLRELEELRQQFGNLKTHNNALMAQLRSARIQPITLEEAMKLRNGEE